MPEEDSEALRHHLADMTDEELLASVTAGTLPTGLGVSSTTTIGVEKVFVKRLPLTDVEAARPYSTRNHFELPTFYSYGVGSAGFGAWRELAALQAVSDVSGLPVHLHHRVMPRSSPPQSLGWSEEAYVRYWGEAHRLVVIFRPATRQRRSCGLCCLSTLGLEPMCGWRRTPRT